MRMDQFTDISAIDLLTQKIDVNIHEISTGLILDGPDVAGDLRPRNDAFWIAGDIPTDRILSSQEILLPARCTSRVSGFRVMSA